MTARSRLIFNQISWNEPQNVAILIPTISRQFGFFEKNVFESLVKLKSQKWKTQVYAIGVDRYGHGIHADSPLEWRISILYCLID
jgi:hypothetical protein